MSTDARARILRPPAGPAHRSLRPLPVWVVWTIALALCTAFWVGLGAGLYLLVAG
jgi:type VI protein secretion system component VasF